jgi:class 3 adenylate cyclase
MASNQQPDPTDPAFWHEYLARVELTALGDAVNVTARLAFPAAAGEILVTTDAAAAAGLDPPLERPSLELKGKSLATEVISLTVSG